MVLKPTLTCDHLSFTFIISRFDKTDNNMYSSICRRNLRLFCHHLYTRYPTEPIYAKLAARLEDKKRTLQPYLLNAEQGFCGWVQVLWALGPGKAYFTLAGQRSAFSSAEAALCVTKLFQPCPALKSSMLATKYMRASPACERLAMRCTFSHPFEALPCC